MANFLSKAPWARKQEGDQPRSPQQDDQSLTTILRTHEDRSSLIILISECTESMRNSLLDVFDPNAVEEKPLEEDVTQSSDMKVDELDMHKEKDHDETGDQERLDSKSEQSEADKAKSEADAQAAAEEKAKREYERRVKELNSQQMKDLKSAAIEHFEKWRDSVLERVGEAVNARVEDDGEESSDSQHAKEPVPEREVKMPHASARVNSAATQAFPPVDTQLSGLDSAKRVLILHSLLLLLLSLEHYPSESRTLLLYISTSLDLPLEILTEDETKVARGLLDAAEKAMSADEHTRKKAQENAVSRRWKVGLGAVGGAVLIGVTGGLAAPLLAAGIGTVMGGLGLGATATATYLGAMAGSAPLVGALFGTYGGYRSAAMMDRYAKEISDFAFIPTRRSNVISSTAPSSSVEPPKENEKSNKDAQRLRVAIGITGWLTTEPEVVIPWHVLSPQGFEPFALRWEMAALLSLGNSLTTLMKSAAWGLAKREIIMRTVFGALAAGLWPLAIVKVSRIVDNPFSVARSRSEKAGKLLADALINKVQGERPVTLIGYSLGARVAYYCLEELAARKAFGLVESAILIGAAVPSDAIAWRRLRSVTAGRLINVYSTNDYILGFLYRTSSLQYGIAGLQAVPDVKGVENIDVSDSVEGHTRYRYLTGSILERVGFLDLDPSAVEKQNRDRTKQDEKDEAERVKKEEEMKEQGKEGQGEDEEQMEQEVQQQNQQSGAMKWISGKMSALNFGGGAAGNNTNPKSTTSESGSPAPTSRTTQDSTPSPKSSSPASSFFSKNPFARSTTPSQTQTRSQSQSRTQQTQPHTEPQSQKPQHPEQSTTTSEQEDGTIPALPPRPDVPEKETKPEEQEEKEEQPPPLPQRRRPSQQPMRSQFEQSPISSPLGQEQEHVYDGGPLEIKPGPIEMEDAEAGEKKK